MICKVLQLFCPLANTCWLLMLPSSFIWQHLQLHWLKKLPSLYSKLQQLSLYLLIDFPISHENQTCEIGHFKAASHNTLCCQSMLQKLHFGYQALQSSTYIHVAIWGVWLTKTRTFFCKTFCNFFSHSIKPNKKKYTDILWFLFPQKKAEKTILTFGWGKTLLRCHPFVFYIFIYR